MKYYAGIGSRTAPPEILILMTQFAKRIEAEGYTLRSGGAQGSDVAFQRGATRKEIFVSGDATPWSIEEVKSCLPTDRSKFDSWKPYVKGLLGRNMMQVLGQNADAPVEFVICYAPSLIYTNSTAGGTGYAIRCALKHGIPMINLFEQQNIDLIQAYLGSTEEFAY